MKLDFTPRYVINVDRMQVRSSFTQSTDESAGDNRTADGDIGRPHLSER